MKPSDKWRCQDCNEISIEQDLLHAPNPFKPSEVITGCPLCKSADGFDAICDVPGCESMVSCGTPTPDGYRHTCSKHNPSRTT